MKNILISITLLLVAAACQEFQPVFTGQYDNPESYERAELVPTHTIAQLADMYVNGKPWTIDEEIIIKGVVSTTDKPGNFYKSFYIQDETGGMEIKIGKNGLYNDYKPGQTVYIKCNGLTLGMYGYKSGNYGGNGMVQLGFVDPTGEYETSYIEVPLIVESHIIRGEIGEELVPEVIEEKDLPSKSATLNTCPYIGKLVTLKGLKYANETFTLLYLDSNKDKKASSNRIFLSDEAWGITTWAMSETKMKEYIMSGIWDSCTVGGGSDNFGKVGEHKGDGTYPTIEKAAYSVSQYFKMGNTEIQIRTSGYSKFSDTEIDPEVLSGAKTIDATGILTLYQGSIQFILIDFDGVKVN